MCHNYNDITFNLIKPFKSGLKISNLREISYEMVYGVLKENNNKKLYLQVSIIISVHPANGSWKIFVNKNEKKNPTEICF